MNFYILENIASKTFLLFKKIFKTQSTFTCSKLTIETLEQGVKYVQS